MKWKFCIHFGSLLLACGVIRSSAVDRFVALDGGHVSPFTSWADAATNIQAAIDAASAGETVWVTNGVYATGGKVMEGDLTNRIALDKTITVQSVNGPQVTAIEGIWPPLNTNGPVGVRCAWLTNDAQLRGFTLRGGSTRSNTTNYSQGAGGGVWGSSSNATIADCFIVTNTCHLSGGGAYQVTITNCLMAGNRATGSGGGAASCLLKNCQVVTNRAESTGGGAVNSTLVNCLGFGNSSSSGGGATMSCTLVNCTMTGNISGSNSIFASAVQNSFATNCIIWGNLIQFLALDPSPNNYFNSTLSYCCTTPLPAGDGNIATDPQLLADGVHITESSPCLAAGSSNVVTGADIDGQPWASIPSIGADQWIGHPLLVKVTAKATGPGKIRFVPSATGQSPLVYYWYRDGVLLQNNGHYAGADSTNLLISDVSPADAGNYQLVLSNSLGTASLVVPLVVRCVDTASPSPSPPYTNWISAATNIQDAVDAANAGDVILATNGVYATGGKVIPGDMMNRVAVDKAVTVMSMNGFSVTTISGAAAEPGPAVRPVWLADDAVFCGFKIQDGASIGNGGGIWCSSTRASVLDCYVVGNYAKYGGGGCFSGILNNCIIQSNRITFGYFSFTRGGGTCKSVLNNCTVNYNASPWGAAGCEGGVINNSIVWDNGEPARNHDGCTFRYSCTFPLPDGPGNISIDPQLVDPAHIAVTSPCRGTGSALYACGVDIDGESWDIVPSMGCDEVIESGLTGLLQLALSATRTNLPINRPIYLNGDLTGRVTRLEWSFGDGPIVTDRGYATSYSWTNAGDYLVTLTAYNADNPSGISATIPVQVTMIEAPVLTITDASPLGFQFQFEGQPEIIYSVYYTTDLSSPITWTLLGTVTGDGNPIQIAEPMSPLENRFYRVVAE